MRRLTRLILGAATVPLLFGAVACGDDDDSSGDGGASFGADGGDATGDGAAESVTVDVDDNFFEPEVVEIATGGTVTWEWVGVEPHNVSAPEFESDIQEDGTFEHTFEEAGSFDYVCTIHPGMEGTVEVSSD